MDLFGTIDAGLKYIYRLTPHCSIQPGNKIPTNMEVIEVDRTESPIKFEAAAMILIERG